MAVNTSDSGSTSQERKAPPCSTIPCSPALLKRTNGNANKLHSSDRAFHDWYRFVLSFPPHLVRDYIQKFNLGPKQTILDPFCGTGTTLVEAKHYNIRSIGIEANPIAHFATSIKVNWGINPDQLLSHALSIAAAAEAKLKRTRRLRTLPPESLKLLLKDSISPIPLHKALVLLEQMEAPGGAPYPHEKLALAKTLVFSASNLHFGPEVGVRRNKLDDAPVIETWLDEIRAMAANLRSVGPTRNNVTVYQADSRDIGRLLKPRSIDAVFTSPPYPNEKDYTRTTRLESVVLGFIKDKGDLQTLKKQLLRSNTRNVYKGDDDDRWIAEHSEIQDIATAIETKRLKLGKTSGFEKLYGKVTKLYFGGMARHLAELRPFLRRGAHLAYVVGDQASYLQVMIRTGQLLADIAISLGYEVLSIDLFRTRLATATKKQMREEVVVLRWPG